MFHCLRPDIRRHSSAPFAGSSTMCNQGMRRNEWSMRDCAESSTWSGRPENAFRTDAIVCFYPGMSRPAYRRGVLTRQEGGAPVRLNVIVTSVCQVSYVSLSGVLLHC